MTEKWKWNLYRGLSSSLYQFWSGRTWKVHHEILIGTVCLVLQWVDWLKNTQMSTLPFQLFSPHRVPSMFNLTCSYGPNPGNHLSPLESDPGLALAWFPSHRARETFLVQMLGLSSELTTRPVPFMFLVSSIHILEMLTPRTTVDWLLSPRTHVSISLSFSPHPFLI